MKIGIVLSTDDPEKAWNALRFGVTALDAGHEVQTFLLAAGVELEGIPSDRFDVQDQLAAYLEAGGEVLACGTCLDLRQQEGTEACPVSTMQDLLALVEGSDRVVTVG